MARFDGVPVVLAGTEYLVPPLTIRALRRLEPQLALLAKAVQGSTPDAPQLDAVVAVVHAAMERNYPNLTKEDLEELLDLGNIPQVIMAVMTAAGLERRPPGEAARPAGSTGGTSPGASPPASA
jgi:hypothetical protein